EIKQNGFDQKIWNAETYKMGLSYGLTDKLAKKINAYFAKNKIINGKTSEWLRKYDEEEFDKFIKEQYDIKGEVTPQKIMKAKKKTDIPLEKEEQKRLCKWLKENKIGHWANGLGVKLDYDVKYMASLRSQGYYTGIPDMTILLGNGKVCFVELKRQKGGRVSEEQKKWIDYLNKNGYPAKVCNGCDEATQFIESLRNND
ncbi:MAG: VRR-NUC domain-containing protein, partial [Candidatus Gastranaerophilaceae bacterium]